ncbi:LCP2 [Symbiodinium sp. KB8]|nr:LCP2 [Symbiodinium sp. KB8]
MGDPPQGATSTSTTSVWWGEWNFRVLLGWTNLMVFSTPEQKGSLGTEGGWALYLLDKVGVISFGRYWPVAGWTALATLMIGLLTALGVPQQWTPSTFNGKYEGEGPDDVPTTWSFASLKEQSGCSLTGPIALGSTDMDCG